MRQFVFLLTSILFSILLYVLHPFFYEWNLFAALRNESHDVSLFVVSLLCVVLVAIPAAFIRSGVYAIFNACLLFTLFIPFFSLMPYYNPRYVFSEVSCFAVIVSVMFSIMGVFFGLKSFKVDWCGFGYIRKTQFLFVLFLINIFNICLILFTFKDIFSFGAISNIYMQRAIYTESANVVSYFVNWQFMVFSPLLLLISMMRRRLDLIVLALIGFFVVFSITAFKVALLVPFLMVVGFVTSGLWKKRVGVHLVSTLFLLMILVAFWNDFGSENKSVSALLVDRVVYAHGVISLFIIEMFSDAQLVYWSNSFLRHFVDPVYDVDPFVMVGNEYWGKFVRANTGFFGDGFINAGWLGVLGSTLVAALLLGVAQSLLEDKYGHYAYLIFLPHIVSMLNGPIQVSLITNGLVVLLALSFFAPAFSMKLRLGDRGYK